MPVEFTDRSGQPRSVQEIREALAVVERRIVKVNTADPELFLTLPTIRDCLRLVLKVAEKQEPQP